MGRVSVRVLHVIPSVSPKRGGPSAAIFPMVRALNENGIRAEIATTNDDGENTFEVPFEKLIQREGVPIRFFPRWSPRVRALREFACAPGFRPWLEHHFGDYDLIHAHALFSYLPSQSMRLARARGLPYVIRPLGQLGRWPLRQSFVKKKLFLALGERTNLRLASAVHFTSGAEQEEARELKWLGSPVVIPHGVEMPVLLPEAKARLRAHYGLPLGQKVVLFLGRLHEKKGLDFLIPAVASVPDAVLILAGEGEPAFICGLDSLIDRHGMATRVIRAGLVLGEVKQLLLQGADVFALTSRHENFGLAVLEAIAAGTPVLISKEVALSSEIGRSLGQVVPLAIDSIAAALRFILRAEAPPGSSADRADLLARYSWKANAMSLSALYASILDAHAPR